MFEEVKFERINNRNVQVVNGVWTDKHVVLSGWCRCKRSSLQPSSSAMKLTWSFIFDAAGPLKSKRMNILTGRNGKRLRTVFATPRVHCTTVNC